MSYLQLEINQRIATLEKSPVSKLDAVALISKRLLGEINVPRESVQRHAGRLRAQALNQELAARYVGLEYLSLAGSRHEFLQRAARTFSVS